jgi:hypothetical protein
VLVTMDGSFVGRGFDHERFLPGDPEPVPGCQD